jgi:SAM-dependent methyltransferase
MTSDSQSRRCFLDQYRQVRHAEGRGSRDPDYYTALPYQDLTGQNSAMWAMRARTYSYFESRILSQLERSTQRPLDILDLGAGNCWMSYRLSLRGHHTTALDIFTDHLDGLNAARGYPVTIPAVEAEFDSLPFNSRAFDLAVFNASLHYSTNYSHTLGQVARCLRPSGHVVILDSPVYRRPEHGRRMVEQRKKTYRQKYGFASDAMGSIEFLDEQTLGFLARDLGIKWRVYRPWYGWRWHARPFAAMLKGDRPPSRFWILVGRFQPS